METAFRSEETFTQEEFWDWLQERPASDAHHYELIRGRIVMSPPAGWPHASVAGALVHLLRSHVRSRGLGLVFESSAGYDLPPGDTLEPDVSFISGERFAAGPAPVRGRLLRIVPNLVVEVLSDSTALRDRTEKLAIYAACGVEECWLVDTARREIAVFSRGEEGFAPACTFRRGPTSSSVLPELALCIEDVFVDVP
jgi:Uma2 family endonuclease